MRRGKSVGEGDVTLATFSKARARMVHRQLVRGGIHDRAVLAAMGEVPREDFVPADLRSLAYRNRSLPIGEGQTISQPVIVAEMAQAACASGANRVLEIGTGSGYAAAILSKIATCVYTIERHARFAEAARARFGALGYDNIQWRIGDGAQGWPEAAPFDAILVSARALHIPEALKTQLRVGGRLIMPVGGPEGQNLIRVMRCDATIFEEDDLGAVRFVPLVSDLALR